MQWWLTIFAIFLLFPHACVCESNETRPIDPEFLEELEDNASITGSPWSAILLGMELMELVQQYFKHRRVNGKKIEHALQGVHASYGEWNNKRVEWENQAAVSMFRHRRTVL
jgi:hypothetical protein